VQQRGLDSPKGEIVCAFCLSNKALMNTSFISRTRTQASVSVKEQQRQALSSFSREHVTTRRFGPQVGARPISSALIELMGGYWVESEEGKGRPI